MYKSLKTNLPKEVMEYPDFHYQIKENKSYLDGSSVQQYLEDYAENYGLKKYIKFNYHIKKVNPLEGKRWQIIVTNLKTKIIETLDFDQIIICTGNFCHPKIPNIEGIENFKGITIHSFEYKVPSKFENKKTVVVGSGFSGLDISFEISNTASKVYLSHHSERLKNSLSGNIPSNFIQKGDIHNILEDGVIFDDGSFETVDSIIFCTGYKFDYPFLSPECGIYIENNHIQPLFKHIVNIEHPTMCFLGIPIKTAPFPLFDLQARFAKTFLSGTKCLPNKGDMLEDTRKDVEKRLANGARKNELHDLAAKSKDYFDDLANFADIKPIAPVILRIFCEAFMRVMTNFFSYRKDLYKIIDKVHYTVKYTYEENPITK
ncbi:senecionine N-oxygenase-like isoform X2 [Daktulosphaira vitifoliae]|nr:senecionine N-oxygenase-like isoform X2 [Daktulosphaira vitifoliae]